MLRPALITVLVLAATPAAAQSLLKGLARSAARAAVENVAKGATSPDTADESPEASGGAPARTPAPRKSAKAYVSDVPKPADAAQKRKALDDFSAYPCDDCEGGRGYDAWGRQILGLTGYNAWENKVGGLAVGESLTWKGHAATGALSVAAEAEHGGFPCKEVVWKITKGKATAERDGLFCFGYASSYSGKETWSEVY